MNDYLSHLGNWSTGIASGVRNKETLVISEKQSLAFVHGGAYQYKLAFYESNDTVHYGIITLGSGKLLMPNRKSAMKYFGQCRGASN